MQTAYNGADTTYRELIGSQVGRVGNEGGESYFMPRIGGWR